MWKNGSSYGTACRLTFVQQMLLHKMPLHDANYSLAVMLINQLCDGANVEGNNHFTASQTVNSSGETWLIRSERWKGSRRLCLMWINDFYQSLLLNETAAAARFLCEWKHQKFVSVEPVGWWRNGERLMTFHLIFRYVWLDLNRAPTAGFLCCVLEHAQSQFIIEWCNVDAATVAHQKIVMV